VGPSPSWPLSKLAPLAQTSSYATGQGVIQMLTSALFVAKTNIKFFKICSVSTSDMDRRKGRARD